MLMCGVATLIMEAVQLGYVSQRNGPGVTIPLTGNPWDTRIGGEPVRQLQTNVRTSWLSYAHAFQRRMARDARRRHLSRMTS